MSDYISRDLLLKEIDELNAVSFYELNDHSNEAYHEIKNLIEHISAADVVEQRIGKWIEYGEPDPWNKFQVWYWKCSECCAVGIDEWSYCQNCGARMVNDHV